MNPVQFIIFSLFLITCIIVTYMNSKRMIGLRKQRDDLAIGFYNLYNHVNSSFPEGLHKEEEVMLKAKAVLLSVVGLENKKKIS